MIITLECNHLLTSNESQVDRFSSIFNLKLCKMMPQGDKDKNDKFSYKKMAVKVTKGQICDGITSICDRICENPTQLCIFEIPVY